MRVTPMLATLVLATSSTATAEADSFVELAGGIMMPVEDEAWTNYVDSGPKLATRIGTAGKVGGMLSVDWTPINTDNTGYSGPFGTVDVSSHRFRILMSVATQQSFKDKLSFSVRVGAGIDIGYVSIESDTVLGSSSMSDTDSGIAIEAAGGLWFNTGSMQIGGELALPLSFHADDMEDEIDLDDYSSFDIDILFGVRFLSR